MKATRKTNDSVICWVATAGVTATLFGCSGAGDDQGEASGAIETMAELHCYAATDRISWADNSLKTRPIDDVERDVATKCADKALKIATDDGGRFVTTPAFNTAGREVTQSGDFHGLCVAASDMKRTIVVPQDKLSAFTKYSDAETPEKTDRRSWVTTECQKLDPAYCAPIPNAPVDYSNPCFMQLNGETKGQARFGSGPSSPGTKPNAREHSNSEQGDGKG